MNTSHLLLKFTLSRIWPDKQDMKTILPLMIVAVCSTALVAQTTQQVQQIQRVDQAVGDLDGLSRSLRQQDGGLRLDGEHTSLYTIPQDKIKQLQVLGQAAQSTGVQRTNAYLRIAPGVTTQSDQTNYLVPHKANSTGLGSNVAPDQDGAFYEKIPANTVFILSPQLPQMVRQSNLNEAQQTTQTNTQTNKLQPKRVDNRVASRLVNNRVDNRYVGQRIDNRVSRLPYQPQRFHLQQPQKLNNQIQPQQVHAQRVDNRQNVNTQSR